MRQSHCLDRAEQVLEAGLQLTVCHFVCKFRCERSEAATMPRPWCLSALYVCGIPVVMFLEALGEALHLQYLTLCNLQCRVQLPICNDHHSLQARCSQCRVA